MDERIGQLHQILQKLIGLHRSLLENSRLEREALVNADIKGIQEATYAKEALIEGVRQQESLRAKLVGELAAIWKRPSSELTLPNIIIHVQGRDLKAAEQLRTSLVALATLVERTLEQNRNNRALVERSLEHVHEMKKNVLGEAAPKSDTYGSHGQKKLGGAGARFVSKEV